MGLYSEPLPEKKTLTSSSAAHKVHREKKKNTHLALILHHKFRSKLGVCARGKSLNNETFFFLKSVRKSLIPFTPATWAERYWNGGNHLELTFMRHLMAHITNTSRARWGDRIVASWSDWWNLHKFSHGVIDPNAVVWWTDKIESDPDMISVWHFFTWPSERWWFVRSTRC